MKCVIFYTLLLIVTIDSKPVVPSIDSLNEIIGGNRRDDRAPRTEEIENVISPLSDDEVFSNAKEIENEKSLEESSNAQPSINSSFTSSPPSYNPLAAFLYPLTQRIQFSPQKFLTDRLIQLRQTLGNFGIMIPNNFGLNQTIARQLSTANGLIHLTGLNDDGFYTDRLEPAGFFSGNGWFANKGGLLGGPGAILSTGSLLTDYPTPYKK